MLANCEIKPFETEEQLSNHYQLIIKSHLAKQEIKNDQIYLKQNLIYEKILISYGLAQDLILCRTTYSLHSVIKYSQRLAEFTKDQGISKLSYSQILKNLGRLYIMRDAFALSKGVLDCPKYSYYKSYLGTYNMVCK